MIKTEVKVIEKDLGSEIFPSEDLLDTSKIKKLGLGLARRRGNPKNYRRFESDIQYNSYPDIFPNKFSELLFDSLLCLQAIEQVKPYTIDFSSYHNFYPLEKKCKVDLIGCLIGVRYRINYTLDVMPHLFPSRIATKFQSLAAFELGDLQRALGLMYSELPDDLPPTFKITPYKESPEDYKKEIREFVHKLEEFNL